jgi:hypothetical protein
MKFKTFALIMSIPVFILILSIFLFGNWGVSYGAIKENWVISLPSPDQEIYYYDSGADSFLGDGTRYHVINYAKKIK